MECHVGQWFCCRWPSSNFLCLKVRAMVGWWLIVGGYKVEDSVHSPRHGLWWCFRGLLALDAQSAIREKRLTVWYSTAYRARTGKGLQCLCCRDVARHTVQKEIFPPNGWIPWLTNISVRMAGTLSWAGLKRSWCNQHHSETSGPTTC